MTEMDRKRILSVPKRFFLYWTYHRGLFLNRAALTQDDQHWVVHRVIPERDKHHGQSIMSLMAQASPDVRRTLPIFSSLWTNVHHISHKRTPSNGQMGYALVIGK